jgi:hypothetical protein
MFRAGKMIRIIALASVPIAMQTLAMAVAPRPANADEIRRPNLPVSVMGTWAEKIGQCASKDKSNVIIENGKYGDASGSCAVRWVVQTVGGAGANYAVHALCTSAEDRSKTQIVDIIIRPQGTDRAAMGRSFQDLKVYQRCPAE